MNRFLYWLTARLPCRLISLDSGPYLERYYLGTLLGVTFYLHRFVSCDGERHLHNHPWRWGGALVLCGGYIEERGRDLCPAAGPAGWWTERVRVQWLNVVNGTTVHRIAEVEPRTWTLFFHGPREQVGGQPKGWGFFEQLTVSSKNESGRPVTLFEPYPSSPGEWWKTALCGRTVGRVPL